MFEKSTKTFTGRREYLKQMARALYHLAETQHRVGLEKERAHTLQDYEGAMVRLSEIHERKLVYDDLETLIQNNWD